MRNISLLLLMSYALVVNSQNSTPKLSNLTAVPDTIAKTIKVTFDLSDNESDDIEISVKLSDDAGVTFLADVTSFSGDIGFPISPGIGKQLTFSYASFTENIFDAQVKIIADDRMTVNIQDLVDQVDSTKLFNDLQTITGIRHFQTNPTHLEFVKDFIEARFNDNDMQTYRQGFVRGGYNAHNIIGRLQGHGDEGKTYIIDGHFDTVNNSPGADDNGTSVVGMLEAMRILSAYNFDNSIKFIGFDFEETFGSSGLAGSAEYILSGIEDYEELAGVVNFEMIGFHSNKPNTQILPAGFDIFFPSQVAVIEADSMRGNFITNVTNADSENLADAFGTAATTYVPDLKVSKLVNPQNFPLPDLMRSDHASFWTGGFKALMITDGANFRNPAYHTPNDTIGALNFTFMTNVVKAAIATVAELAVIQHSDVKIVNVSMSTGLAQLNNCEMTMKNKLGILSFSHVSCSENNLKIEVYNIEGKRIAKGSFVNQNATISTVSYLPGLYVAIISDGRGAVSRKFIIR